MALTGDGGVATQDNPPAGPPWYDPEWEDYVRKQAEGAGRTPPWNFWNYLQVPGGSPSNPTARPIPSWAVDPALAQGPRGLTPGGGTATVTGGPPGVSLGWGPAGLQRAPDGNATVTAGGGNGSPQSPGAVPLPQANFFNRMAWEGAFPANDAALFNNLESLRLSLIHI